MPRFLLRLDDDLFVEWSTVVDAPVTYGMTLNEVKGWLEADGTRAEVDKPAALERLLTTGTSHIDVDQFGPDSAIVCNRAGPGEKHLSKSELIAYVRQMRRVRRLYPSG